MSFADDFAVALAARSIDVEATSLPDRDTIQQELTGIQTWLSELDDDVRDGFDEGTAEFKLCHIIADPEIDENTGEVAGVNVAPNLSSLMAAFDEVNGQSLTEMLQSALDAFDEADVA